ncbi:glycogen synthase GlgA [Verrucomicrobiota bacterium]
MKIWFVSSEIVPFASTGGLGDVANALPKALAAAGHEVYRVMPLYRKVYEGPFEIEDSGIELEIPMGDSTKTADIWQLKEENGLTTYFVRYDEYFDRSQLYCLSHRDYEDNFARFVLFQKAAVALIDTLGLKPDIVHCNDWQAGLVPLFLKNGVHGQGRVSREKTVFTIHNLAYQGVYPFNQFAKYANLNPHTSFRLDTCEFYGQVNSLKAGITQSDEVTTVSPTYAEEIKTEEFGCGMEGILQDHSHKLCGLLNGVDYSVWDPAIDDYLVEKYDVDSVDKKMASKKHLLKLAGFGEGSEDVPMLGVVSRLADQKGIDLIEEIMPELMKYDVRFFLLGSGHSHYEHKCQEWMDQYPDKFFAHIGFSQELAHQVEAGSDLFLMPSKFEPCGLNQMYSQKYGTLPVVHAVGGLNDTVVDYMVDPENGNGFKFTGHSAASFMNSIKRAISLYSRKEEWTELVKRAMQIDNSVESMADHYVALYEQALTK